MSFRCDNCDTPQPIGVGPIMVVTHIKSYVPAPGSEIVKEIKACRPCSEKLGDAIEMEPMKNEAFLESIALANNPDNRPSSWKPISYSRE